MIYCAEIVSWSWKCFFSAFKLTDVLLNLLVGLVIGTIFGSNLLFQGNLSDFIRSTVGSTVLITFSIRLIAAIFQDISSNKLNDHHRSVPNEGIKRSFFHGNVSFVLGLTTFACFTIITSVLALLSTAGPIALANQSNLQASLSRGLTNALLLEPISGLLVALSLGWLASWQHTVLRIILHMTNILPLKLSPFLNDATNSVLLRRIGGGYIFIHRTLLEYFASLDDTPLPTLQPPQPSLEDPEPLVRLL